MNIIDINKINMCDKIENNMYEEYTLNELKTLIYIKTKNNKIDEVNEIKKILNKKISQQQNFNKNINDNPHSNEKYNEKYNDNDNDNEKYNEKYNENYNDNDNEKYNDNESIKLINNIKNKSKKIIITASVTDSSDESDDKSVKSNDLIVQNNDINKLYDRLDKKGQNQRFTQTSQKLFDRMFSEASYINKIGSDNVVIKPFSDDNNKKLGIRKNIKKYS